MVSFDSKCQPEATAGVPCAKNRYVTDGCAIVDYDGHRFIAATDGRALAMVACETDATDKIGQPYPSAAFVAARKASFGKRPATLSLNGVARVVGRDGATVEYKPLDNRFPDVVGIARGVDTDERVGSRIILNVGLLANIAKALGAEAVELHIRDGEAPVVVRPCREGIISEGPAASRGYLMPEVQQ